MAVLIRDAEAGRIVRELAARTGETITQAVKVAAEERLARLAPGRAQSDRAAIEQLLKRMRSHPVTDGRTADEIIGYDENGLPA